MNKTILVDDLDNISEKEDISGIVYERICDAFAFNRSKKDDPSLKEIPIERFWAEIVGPVMDDCRGDDFLLSQDEEFDGTDEEMEELIENLESEFDEMYSLLIDACKTRGITHIKVNSRFYDLLDDAETE